jgi:hypothetical protein
MSRSWPAAAGGNDPQFVGEHDCLHAVVHSEFHHHVLRRADKGGGDAWLPRDSGVRRDRSRGSNAARRSGVVCAAGGGVGVGVVEGIERVGTKRRDPASRRPRLGDPTGSVRPTPVASLAEASHDPAHRWSHGARSQRDCDPLKRTTHHPRRIRILGPGNGWRRLRLQASAAMNTNPLTLPSDLDHQEPAR